MAKIDEFFCSYSFYWFHSSKNYVDFPLQSVIWRIKSIKYADFGAKARKLVVLIKDNAWKNWENIEIKKLLDNNFP